MDLRKSSSRAQLTTLSDTEVSELSKLLHVGDAAKFLAVSKRTLQQLTAERSVAHIKFGRNVRYDIADLQRFAESRKIREIGWKANQNPSPAK